jgi:hypothetical protein
MDEGYPPIEIKHKCPACDMASPSYAGLGGECHNLDCEVYDFRRIDGVLWSYSTRDNRIETFHFIYGENESEPQYDGVLHLFNTKEI